MFFMMGITGGQKELAFQQTVICDRCGKYGRYTVFMTYTVLSLFFIPVFKWGKQYYVKTTCCGATYQLDPAVGRRIERGEEIQIHPEDLQPVGGQSHRRIRYCDQCGYTTDEEFEYCPKCGKKF